MILYEHRREVIVENSTGRHIYNRNNLPEKFTTDVQAEVLIKGDIDKKFIKKIIFNSETVKENWCNQHYSIIKNYRVEVLPEYFGLRDNFLSYWGAGI